MIMWEILITISITSKPRPKDIGSFRVKVKAKNDKIEEAVIWLKPDKIFLV